MNIALKKLAMLEKALIEKEESAKLQGYTSVPIDTDLRKRITFLMDKVRTA